MSVTELLNPIRNPGLILCDAVKYYSTQVAMYNYPVLVRIGPFQALLSRVFPCLLSNLLSNACWVWLQSPL